MKIHSFSTYYERGVFGENPLGAEKRASKLNRDIAWRASTWGG